MVATSKIRRARNHGAGSRRARSGADAVAAAHHSSAGPLAPGVPGNADDPLALERFVCFALYAASHAFSRVYKPLLDDIGLTYPQYLVMVVLWRQDDQTVGTIGDALSLDSNTLTPLLKRLASAGLVGRSRDTVDERQVRIRLTEAGRALRERALTIPPCIGEATGLSPDALADLTSQLATLRKSLASAAGR